MRTDKYMLFQPPKLKLSKSKLNVQQLSRLQQDSNVTAANQSVSDQFDEVQFQSQYSKALQLLAANGQKQSKSALSILQVLTGQIRRIPEESSISVDMIEKVVINCWRIKHSFKNLQLRKQQSLNFIRREVQYLSELYKRRQIHKNGLSMLYLIQANEQFDEKLYYDALKSCEMSTKYCSSIKNHPHLLKLQYLKSNILASLGNTSEQLQSIKKCMRFINSITANTDQEALKDFTSQLKKNLIERQLILKERPSQQKSVDLQGKPSTSLFRKRSLSQKKQVKKDLVIEKQPEVKNRRLMKSIHTRSANLSKYNTLSKQEKPTFLPVDLTKFNKTQLKLKKKPLKLQAKNMNNQFSNHVMDEIEYIQAPTFDFGFLMVRRPNQQIQPIKRSNHKTQQQQNQMKPVQEIQIHSLVKKQSSQKQEEKIEPVTHYITRSHQTNDEIVEEQHLQLIHECVRVNEEILFKAYLKKIDEEVHDTDRMSSNASNYKRQIEEDSQFSSSNQFQKIHESNIFLSRSQSRNHLQMAESQSRFDFSINIDNGEQLVTYLGILSLFKFSIALQKKESENEVGQFFKEIYISFSAVLNKRENLFTTLTFRYYNPYEKNLQIIIEQVCKNELDSVFSGENIKLKLLRLVSNRLVISKKPNGLTLLQKQQELIKENQHIDYYIRSLYNYFIIFQQHQLTDFNKSRNKKTQIKTVKKMIENTLSFRMDENDLSGMEETSLLHQILSFYIPNLTKRMADDLKEDKSSHSSHKRMRTERFYKNTILSYQSLIKSLNESDINAKFTFEDQKSLALMMPSDFNSKISSFFENQGQKDTSIYQFYYCMKFILIQPTRSQSKEIVEPVKVPQVRRRTSSIANAVKQADNIKESKLLQEINMPGSLEDTLTNFYDSIELSQLFYLQNKKKVNIRMKCYKVKQIFKRSEEYFYKFNIEFNGEKIKMMKFIATSYDVSKVMQKKASNKEKKLKSSRKIKQKISKEQYQIPSFDKKSLLTVLKEIAERMFIKKDYIYSMVGLENNHSQFHYINKFKLQGKTVQNKQFMIPHLKAIHILLQKSIRANCDHFKEFAVCTIRQIQGSIQFNIILYFPKYQRTFSVALTKNIFEYLHSQNQAFVFDGQTVSKQVKDLMFKNHQEEYLKQTQSKYWNNFVKLFAFQMHYYEQKMQMFLKIGNFTAFLKDSCFSQYFEFKDKIFHLQISLSKKYSVNASQIELKHARSIHPKRKSSSSKEIIKRNNFLQLRDMKSSGRVLKPSIRKKCEQQIQLFKKGDFFQRISKIYQTQTSKYVLYLSLSKIYDMENQEEQQKETCKISFSFYLSDMLSLLKESKKDLITREEKIQNQFNEEVFSFAILVRAMTVIKYKLINQLKSFKDIDALFEGETTIKTQKQFKNNLIKAFGSQNQNLYSLNSIKKFYRLENNVYLINKYIINSKRNIMATTFYDQKGKKITFYLTSSDHISKQKVYLVKDMKLPWIELYNKHQLFKISQRISQFYKNILLFS